MSNEENKNQVETENKDQVTQETAETGEKKPETAAKTDEKKEEKKPGFIKRWGKKVLMVVLKAAFIMIAAFLGAAFYEKFSAGHETTVTPDELASAVADKIMGIADKAGNVVSDAIDNNLN